MSNSEPTFAQTGGSVFGLPSLVWRTLFGAKVDQSGGYSINQTLTTPTINGLPIPSSILTGVADPLSNTTGTVGLKIAATLAVVAGNLDFANENANLIFAGPTSGGAAKPTFRAMVAADLPGGAPVSSFNTRTGAIVSAATDYATYERSYLSGLITSNDGSLPNTTIDIAAGSANDSTNAITIQIGNFKKNTGGAWVSGTNNAGMGNGLTITANTLYAIFLIINSGAADIYFDTSPTAANAPSGTTAFRRIWWFRTAPATTNIVPYYQNGDECGLVTSSTDINVSNLGTAMTLFPLIVPPDTVALIRGFCTLASGPIGICIASPYETGTTSCSGANYTAVTGGAGAAAGFDISVRANASSQIKAAANAGSGTTFIVATHGWIDRRGRDA